MRNQKLSSIMNELIPGRYRHYRGNEYIVIGIARHSETLEEHVVYRQEYGDHGLWVRPKQIFSETVKVDGQDVPRFQPLGSSSEAVGESVTNIFDDLPQHLPKEVVQTLSFGHAATIADRRSSRRPAGLANSLSHRFTNAIQSRPMPQHHRRRQ